MSVILSPPLDSLVLGDEPSLLDFLRSPSLHHASPQSPQSSSSFDTDFDLEVDFHSPQSPPPAAADDVTTGFDNFDNHRHASMMMSNQNIGEDPMMFPHHHCVSTAAAAAAVEDGSHNTVVFEQLLESLHNGQAEQCFPMDDDFLSEPSSMDDEYSFDSSSAASSANLVTSSSFLPAIHSFTPAPTPSPVPAVAARKTQPHAATAVHKAAVHKVRLPPLALPKNPTFPLTAAARTGAAAKCAPKASSSSPPSSPPSSPDSTSSRSPSPMTGHGTGTLSTKPSKVQIGKNITIEISEEDLVSLELSQIAKLAGTNFTKAEEKELKRLRRKSRNKVSAAQSRNKKKNYLSGLEERVDAVNSLNVDLKKRLKELERENALLRDHVDFLVSHVEPSVRATLPAAIPTEPAATSTPSASVTEVSSTTTTASKTKQSSGKVASSTTTSLLAAAHTSTASSKQKGATSSAVKSTGVYLMLVFISFGIFFNMATQPGNSSSSSLSLATSAIPGALSRLDASLLQQQSASPSQRSFVMRKMHSYDDSLMMMDTVPMLDHLDQPNATCDDEAFWDAYYEADLATVDFNDKYKHDVVMWRDCPDTEFHDLPLASKDLVGLDHRLKDIKAQLENHEAVENVVCSTSMCIVRLEQNEVV